MPLVTVTLRARLEISDTRERLLYHGDVTEFDNMTLDLRTRLRAANVVIDDIDCDLPIPLRMKRD